MIQRAFNRASDAVEQWLSFWHGVAIYWALALGSAWAWGWDGIDRFLTISGGAIILILIGLSRRDSLAAQAKLDAIDPDPDHNEIEQLTEAEILERRHKPG